jgi:hypothetical protein
MKPARANFHHMSGDKCPNHVTKNMSGKIQNSQTAVFWDAEICTKL